MINCPDPRVTEFSSVFVTSFRRNVFLMPNTDGVCEVIISEPTLPRELVVLKPNDGIIIITDNEVL